MPLSAHLSSLNHRHVDSSASTNSELIDAVKDGSLSADEAHLLTAETQTAGRGQRGRSWQSPRGNVYLSLYHPVQIPVSGLLSLIIGLELAKMPVIQNLNEQLRAQGLTPIGVKWANDLGFYQGSQHLSDQESQDQGKSTEFNTVSDIDNDIEPAIIYFSKLAGILIEPVWRAGKLVGVVMGVGLNVQSSPKLTTQTCEGMSYQALSLQDIYQRLEPPTNRGPLSSSIKKSINTDIPTLPSLQEIYQQISQALLAAMTCFEHLSAEKLSAQTIGAQTNATDDFMQQFASMDALAGLRLRVTQNHNGEPHIINGHACGIDTEGCLQLRQDNGKLAALFTGRIDVINGA